jgi:hypothetical protein
VQQFIQQLVNQKIKEVSPQELMKYATMYNIELSHKEAIKVIKILRQQKQIDIHNSQQHKKIIQTIAKEVDPALAKKADQLLQQFKKKL